MKSLLIRLLLCAAATANFTIDAKESPDADYNDFQQPQLDNYIDHFNFQDTSTYPEGYWVNQKHWTDTSAPNATEVCGGQTCSPPVETHIQIQMVEAADDKKFSLKRLDAFLQEIGSNPSQIKSETFADFLDELVKLLSAFGTVMSLAFSDVIEKSNIIRANRVFHLERGNWKPEMSLQEQILWEQANQVAELNGYNNYKLLKKEQKGTWQYTYSSTARNTVRLSWMSVFNDCVLNQLFDTDKELYRISQGCYAKAFADHHPWIVRKAAFVALYFVGNRAQLEPFGFRSIQTYAQTAANSKILANELTRFYTESKMGNLP